MDSAEYQKRKKRKEALRKFVLNFFIWLLIIAFVSTLGVYWGRDINVDVLRIAKIGKENYNYQPGSLFNYILIFNKERFANLLPKSIDEKTFNEILIRHSVETLINQGLISTFARENGIIASKEIIRNIIEFKIRGVLTRTPDKGLLDYAFLDYASFSLAGENGDIMNSLGTVTSSELFSYYDLFSYMAEAEIVLFEFTNYIAKNIPSEELKEYFKENAQRYITEITVEDIATASKELAFEIHKMAKENGFENALSSYKDKIKFTKLVLTKKTGLAKRFELALKLKAGEMVEKPQFENGEYHIFKVKSIPEFENLSSEIRSELIFNFINEKKSTLLKNYKPDIEKILNEVNSQISRGKNLKDISSFLGANYYKIKQIYPISRTLYSEGKIVPLSIEENPEIIDIAFSGELNKITKIQKEEYLILIKPLSKRSDTKFSYTNINEQVMKDYLSFKATAISKDWMNSLKKRYPYKIYTNELEKLISGKIKE